MKEKLKKLLKVFKNWKANKGHIQWMAKQAKPFWKSIAVILFVEIINLALSFATTIVGKYVVDAAIGKVDLKQYVLVMSVLSVVTMALGMGTRLLSSYISESFTFGMRANLFNQIQRGIWQKLSKFHSGDMMTRLTSDVGTVSNGIISVVPGIITLLLRLIIAFSILFYYDRPLALFALILGPFGAALMLVFKERYQKYQKELRESESEYRSYMQEGLANITVLKTFQMEDECSEAIENMRVRRMRTVMASSRMGMWMGGLMQFVFRIGYVVAFCWGAFRISTGEITYGTMTIFLSLVSQIQGPISNLAQIVPQVFGMLVSAERIREISDLEKEDYAGSDVLPSSVGLRIRGVSFAYENETVLSDMNISVCPGDRVGIVGTSGAGKTTFIRLALALVKPNTGSVVFTDEKDAEETASPASRRFISYVPQGNTLLSGSIEKNLRAGRKNAKPEELWAALDVADASDFVRKLPNGLASAVSEHAGGLSEGQAQRIAIARALIRGKPLLILDEATSALDEATESRVLKRITLDSSRTCLIITHRRSMLQYCNKVLEIGDDGKVTMTVRQAIESVG